MQSVDSWFVYMIVHDCLGAIDTACNVCMIYNKHASLEGVENLEWRAGNIKHCTRSVSRVSVWATSYNKRHFRVSRVWWDSKWLELLKSRGSHAWIILAKYHPAKWWSLTLTCARFQQLVDSYAKSVLDTNATHIFPQMQGSASARPLAFD